MSVRWVYRVVIDEKPDEPPEDFVLDDRAEALFLSPEEQWSYYGTQQWARRRYLSLRAAQNILWIHVNNGAKAHIERAPIGPWEST